VSARVRFTSWLRSVFQPSRLRQAMDDEIAFHIASRAADLEHEGFAPKEAARRARVEFGAQAAHRHGMRVSLGLRWPDEVWGDLRYGARLLRRSPGFTVVTIASLALAIGANSAIFSAANELLFSRLGVPHARELRSLSIVTDARSIGFDGWNSYGNDLGNGLSDTDVITYPEFRMISREQTALQPLFGYQTLSYVTMTGAGTALPVTVQTVSGNFYPQMGVQTILGRALGPSDDHVDQGVPLAAVLSYGAWQREFGGAKSVLGRTIHLNGAPATVVGVNPKGFTGAQSVQISPEVFVPLTAIAVLQPLVGDAHPLTDTRLNWVVAMARARPGVLDTAAAAQLTVLLETAIRATRTVKAGKTLPWVEIKNGSRGLDFTESQYGPQLYTLLGLAGLVLLLACVNVANLMLARARTRAQELSLRMAVGAGRARIFRQMLTECLLLAGIGGALGGVLAFVARNVVPRLLWDPTQGADLHVPFDWAVFAFTAGVTLAAAILSGLAPAWQATRQEPGAALKAGGKAQTRRHRFWTGKSLVALEVALSLMLVSGAALFLRTMINLDHIHPGFDTQGLLMFEIIPPGLRYPAGKNLQALERILEQLRSVPGVESATMTSTPLLSDDRSSTSFYLAQPLGKKSRQAEKDISVDYADVAPGYLETMRIPLLAGRAIAPEDAASPQRVAVINQVMAQQIFGNLNPIGRMFSGTGKPPWTEIVGICGNTLYNTPKGEPPAIYFDSLPPGSDTGGVAYVVRTKLQPTALMPSLRRAVARVDADLPLMNILTQEEQIDALTQQERLMADLSLVFAALALLLACVGVYGVLSYSVAERTREIGIRLALGAKRAQVRGIVLREAAWLTALGMSVGMGVTLALAHLVHAQLYGVAPTDIVSLAGSALLMIAVALIAVWIPAARASRVDPMVALRHE
jgi:predicted permease